MLNALRIPGFSKVHLGLLFAVTFFSTMTMGQDKLSSSLSLSNNFCQYSKHYLSRTGRYLAREKFNRTSLGKSGSISEIEIIDTRDNAVVFRSKVPVHNFQWTRDKEHIFYYIAAINDVEVLQRDVRDNSGLLLAKKMTHPLAPYLGDFVSSDRNPLFISLDAGTRGKTIYGEIMTNNAINANLGVIPVQRFESNLDTVLQYKSGYFQKNGKMYFDDTEHQALYLPNTYYWEVDPLGRPIFAVHLNGEANNVLLSRLLIKNQKQHKNTKVNTQASVSFPINSIARDKLLSLGNVQLYPIYNDENKLIKLYSLDNVDTNTISLNERDIDTLKRKRTIYSDRDYDIEKLHISDDGNMLGLSIYKQSEQFIALSEKGQFIQAEAAKLAKLAKLKNLFDTKILSVSADGNKAVIELKTQTQSVLYLFDLQNKTHNKLPQHCLTDDYTTKAFMASEKNSVHVYWSYYGAPDPEKPLWIELHGGPSIREKLVAGYLTIPPAMLKDMNLIRINYRGSAGFGKLNLSVLHNQPNTVYEDVRQAITKLKKHYHLRPSKIYLAGASFGGTPVINIASDPKKHKDFDGFVATNPLISFSSVRIKHPFVKKYRESLGKYQSVPLRTIPHQKPVVLMYGVHDYTVEPETNAIPFLEKNRSQTNVHGLALLRSGHDIHRHDENKLISFVKTHLLMNDKKVKPAK